MWEKGEKYVKPSWEKRRHGPCGVSVEHQCPSPICFSQVNPLAEDDKGNLIAADAKLGFDDNAAFRQKEIFAMKDDSQIDSRCGPEDSSG